MPRILLAGMNRLPNQFSRYLESRGCQTVHSRGDDIIGSIPSDCEAVIIAKCQISHEKFYRTKELYKDLGKPVFVTDFGMTPIKERFEEFLKRFPRITIQEEPLSKTFNPVLPTYMKNNDRADKIITEDYLNHLTPRETYTKLKELRQADGSAYSLQYIISFRESLAREFRVKATRAIRSPEVKREVVEVTPGRERRVEPAKPVEASPTLVARLDELAAGVWKVLLMNLSLDQKATMLWQLINREPLAPQVVIRKTPEGLQFFSTNPIDNVERPLITLNQVQAIAIVQHLAEVEDYATDPSV